MEKDLNWAIGFVIMGNSNYESESPFETYRAAVDQKLSTCDFHQYDGEFPEYQGPIYHSRRLSWSKLSYVDLFITFLYGDSPSTAEMKRFSRASFQFGLANMSPLPRGLGGSLVVYPVIVAESLSRDSIEWVTSYRPRHWCSFEIPSLVDLNKEQIVYNGSKPVWGRWYYEGFHEMIETCFTLDGWQATGTV